MASPDGGVHCHTPPHVLVYILSDSWPLQMGEYTVIDTAPHVVLCTSILSDSL